MAYIKLTDAMVDAARAAHAKGESWPDILRAAMRQGEISMDAPAEPAHVRVWFNGDESVRCQVGGPAVEYVAEVRSVQVARR